MSFVDDLKKPAAERKKPMILCDVQGTLLPGVRRNSLRENNQELITLRESRGSRWF